MAMVVTGESCGSRFRMRMALPPSMLALLIISVPWVFLLAGTTLYFGTAKPGQERLGQLFTGLGIGTNEERPGETGLRHPGREVVRR
ncbi:MAG: hypothetical protein A2Z40_00150 [Deltaproteobacteria bacterium RBG_19FT_COMBO_60_16]|nr:MAG: hypothetical protein A2Z13_08320 [Deltaproteobacteria bacterium RBG_16_64_85]OGQ00869.1 MAG: hypothetical protein A2Z40_00150 [Deltaproteobacteria bacterium RBG_19FT_COMBO_60_16]